MAERTRLEEELGLFNIAPRPSGTFTPIPAPRAAPPAPRTAPVAAPTPAPAAPFTSTEELFTLLDSPPPLAPPPEFELQTENPIQREFIRGLGAGIEQIGTDVRAAGAVGLDLLGFNESAIELMEVVRQREENAQLEFPKAINRVEDMSSSKDFILWAARALGEQAPVLASIALSGGGGAILGWLVGRGLLSTGAAISLAARFPTIGTSVGVFGTATAIETGATASELFEATGEAQPGAALAAGIVKGALEAAVPAALGARFGLSADITGGLLRRFITRSERILPARLGMAAGVGISEAVTEGLQETVDTVTREFVDENFDFLNPETASRILNAAATGGLVGSILGGAAGRLGKVRSARETRPPNAPVELGSDPHAVDFSEIVPGPVAEIVSGPVASQEEAPAVRSAQLPEIASPSLDPQADAATAGDETTINLSNPPVMQPLGPNGSVELEDLGLPPERGLGLPPSLPEKLLPFPTRLGSGVTIREPTAVVLAVQERGEGFPRRSRRVPEMLEGDKYGQLVSAERMDAVVNDLTVNPTALSGATGKSYDSAAHAPGTAVWIEDTAYPLDAQDRARAQQTVAIYNRLMKQFGLTEDKLIVHVGTIGSSVLPSHFDMTGNFGNFTPTASPFKRIGLAARSQTAPAFTREERTEAALNQTDVRFFTTVAHEFGHYLVHKRFADASPALQQKILSAYHRDLVYALQGNLGRYADVFTGPVTALTLTKIRGHTFSQKPALDYYFSFDEWIADQVARHILRKLPQLSPADTFFARLAQEVKQVFRAVGRTFKITEPTVDEWLDTLLQNTNTQTKAGLTLAAQRGINENEQILGQWNNGEFIPPPQASTFGPAAVLTKLGVAPSKVSGIRAFADKFNWFMDLFYNLQQIAQLNPHLAWLNRYVELVDQWYNTQMRWMSRANDRTRAWMSIGNEQQRGLSAFIFEIDQMEYLTVKERAEGIVRQPTNEELEARARKHNLNPVAYELFLDIRNDFLSFLDQIEETSLRDTRRTISDPIIQQQQIAEIEEEFRRLRNRPYFPHSRFGDIALVVKDSKGKTLYMEQFGTVREARAAVPEARREFPDAAIRIDQIPKEVQGFRGLPAPLLNKVREKLGLTEEQQQWLDNLVVEMSPSASFRRRLQRRQNVPGFSLDAMRSYATYFFSGAKHIARIEFKPLMDEEINGFGTEISTLAAEGETVDVRKRRRIQGYMANHLEHILNPKPDWAQARAAAFMWYLGFNPSSAALNLTQPVLVGWPYLSARFGDAKAMQAMMQATRSIQDMYKWNERGSTMSLGLFKAIDRAVKEGVVDESQAAELAAVAQGQHLQRLIPGTRAQRELTRWAHYSSWMFQQSERLNRRIMFRAGWELAMANPDAPYLAELAARNRREMLDLFLNGFTDTQAKAYLAGRDATQQTQFRYAPHARPRFMRGKRGVLFTFFMFQQNMLFFTLNSPGNVRFLVMMLFMAGLMGLPGAEDLSALAKLAARRLLGKEFDVEKETREFVTNLTDDPHFAELLLLGTGRYGFGLPAVMDMVGLPKAQFDFSRRIGMGRVIPGVAELGSPGLSFDERMSRITTDAAGAAFGIGINMIRALQDDQLPVGDFKRWERAMPTVIRNLSRFMRFQREGRERTRTGARLIDFDVTDPQHMAELALVGLGFQPTRLSRAWDQTIMRKEVEAYWTARRGMLLRTFDNSIVTGDAESRRQAMRDIQEYNKTVPFGVMRIARDTLQRSRRERQRSRRLFELGLARERSLRPLGGEIRELFPQEPPKLDVEDTSRMR